LSQCERANKNCEKGGSSERERVRDREREI